MELFPGNAIPEDFLRVIPALSNSKTPASDHVFEVLRPDFRELVPDDEDYIGLFDRFEFLVGLVNGDYRDSRGMAFFVPTGRFGWRDAWDNKYPEIDRMESEADEMQDSWPPLKAGMFNGSFSRFKEVVTAYRTDVLKKLHWGW